MANKFIYLLVMKNDNSSYDIQGVFSTLDKAEKIIIMDFYGGSCPRDKKDFEAVNKRKTTTINNSKLINYYLVTKAVSPYAIIETNLDKDSSVIAVENVTIQEKKPVVNTNNKVAVKKVKTTTNTKNKTEDTKAKKEMTKIIQQEIKETTKLEKELHKQLSEVDKLKSKLSKELATIGNKIDNHKSKLESLKVS